MSVTVYEKPGESLVVSVDSPTIDVPYMAIGSDSTSAVLTALATDLPTTRRGLWLQSYSPVHKGAGVWEVNARYGKLKPTAVNGIGLTGQSTGKTVHKEAALETRSYPGAAEIVDNLIGVTDDRVEGVDAITPTFSFSIDKKFRATEVSPTFVATLIGYTGSVISENCTVMWHGQALPFSGGELLFQGISVRDGGQDSDEVQLIEITYQFEYSPNASGLTIGSITDITKYGWEYMDVRYETTQSGTTLTKSAVSVHVHKIYPEISYAVLGI